MKDIPIKEIIVKNLKGRIDSATTELADAFVQNKLGATIDLAPLKTLLVKLNKILTNFKETNPNV